MKRLYVLCAFLPVCLAAATLVKTPVFLSGTWEDSYHGEGGTMTVVVTKENGVDIEGVLQITGSKDCVGPIPFRGSRSEHEVVVIADAPGVCGYNGVLSAVATKQMPRNTENGLYTGTFNYRFLGGIWKKGTFELRPSQWPKK